MEIVNEQDFINLISERSERLLSITKSLSQCQSVKEILTRPLLGELLSQSTQIEELLDGYGAGNNCKWCRFRSVIAAIKGFSDISYELLHILHALSGYHLLPIEKDFITATNETLEFTSDVLSRAARETLVQAEQIGLTIPTETKLDLSFSETLPKGRLPHLCERRKIDTVSETVILLATAFLNLAADSKSVKTASKAKAIDYTSSGSNLISEEKLRSLQLRFHNLQSLYDTYVSGTEASELDKDLPVLRGHISVVFHLLRTATLFAHHYERHINRQFCESRAKEKLLVQEDDIFNTLMEYSIAFISLYIDYTVNLCQEMIKRYAEITQVELPIPPYRGFHVRPSTLISSIVLHYGSKVEMQLGNESYDAGTTFDLFRANEVINLQKRRWLKEAIDNLKLIQKEENQDNVDAVVLGIVLTLAGQGKVIIYEQPLKPPEESTITEGKLSDSVTDKIEKLFRIGKIDVDINIRATFIGDKRVLNDIKLLAESGYGEDKFGNNIGLPDELSYLRR